MHGSSAQPQSVAPGSAIARGPDRYTALDGLRGWAVLLVFCVHAAGNAANVFLDVDFDTARITSFTTVGERLLFWLYRSHHGVFLFFVLSGYLIARLWWPVPRYGYRSFAWRRTLRIYPAFLLSFVASLLFAYVSGTWQPPAWPRLAANLLFLNGLPGSSVAPFNIVTWSLFYEVTFYLAFPMMLWAAGRVGSRVRATPSVLAAVGVGTPLLAVWLGANELLLCWSLLFVGTALAFNEQRVRSALRRIPGGVVLLLYVVVTSLAVIDAVSASLLILAFGGVAALVLAKCTEGNNVVAWLLARRPLVALGRISYSFYLVHWMVVVLVARFASEHAQALGPVGGSAAIFIVGFAASAMAAQISWWLVERPYFRWFAADRRAAEVVHVQSP